MSLDAALARDQFCIRPRHEGFERFARMGSFDESLSSCEYFWLSQQRLPSFYGLGQVFIHFLFCLTDATPLNGIKNLAVIFIGAATAVAIGKIDAAALSG